MTYRKIVRQCVIVLFPVCRFFMKIGTISDRGLLGLPEIQVINSLKNQKVARDIVHQLLGARIAL